MKSINKVKYQLLKMREAYEAKKNLTIEIPDDEYERLMEYDIVDFPIVNPEPEEPSYTWYKGTATEEQIQSQEYVNSLTYNQLTKPESDTTITLSQGYNTFMFPESWGIPIFGTDTSYNKRDEPYTVDELGITNPEGKIFIAIESYSDSTRYIKW